MTRLWKTPEQMFEIARRELFTAVVGDAMDKMGFRRQFLPPQIRALSPNMVVIGPTMTVLESDVGGEQGDAPPFGRLFDAIDDLKPNEVYICTGSSPTYALWGGLLSTRAMTLKAAGAIVDGYLRDSKEILNLNFPAFCYGTYAQDQGGRGEVLDFRTPIHIGQVRIESGDIVFGDVDGVCVVPVRAADEVFTRAIEKARGEKHVRNALQSGMSAKQAFQTFGIM
jgi:regulator of RNase E activity RraA